MTSTTFVGRAPELAELRAGLTEAVENRPGLAFIAGESGLGKTRLVAELERVARAEGMRVIGGDCVELGEGELPYAPIVTALRPLARSGHEAFGALSAPARAALAQILPGLGRSEARADDEATAQARLFDGLLELLELLAGEDGLLLTIEDLHWADRSTRAFLVYLAASLCRERVLVVTTYRPDELHRRHPLRPLLAELERDARARRVELRPLTRDELGEQLTDILGEAPRGDLLGRLFSRSEGNPLFAEELLAAGTDGRGALPPTLRDALMLRIERLSPDAQELLRVLAAGQPAGPRDPGRGVRLRSARARARGRRRAARRRRRRGLLRVPPRAAARGGRRRPAARRARVAASGAGAGAGGAGRRAARATAARIWPRASRITTWLRAISRPRWRRPCRAAQAAEAVHANGEAAALYARALQLWDRVADAEALTGHDHVELLRSAAWTNDREHEPARAESYLRAAITELGDSDPVRTAQLLELVARQQFGLGRSAAAAETRREALALLPEGPSGTRATLLAGMAKELMLESRLQETVEVADEAIEVARAVGDQVSELRALDAKGVVLFGMARYEEGERALREVMERSQGRATSSTSCSTHVNLADSLAVAGRLAEARVIADEGLELAAARGTSRRWLMLLRAELAFEAGEWAAAEAALPSPGRPAQGMTFINDALRRIELALGRGEHDAARVLLDQARDIACDTREPQWIGPLGALRAELERRSGDLVAAAATIDDALDRLDFCSQDVARMARVSAAGARVHADAAVRARDLGEDPSLPIAMAEGLIARVEACAEGDRPVEAAFLATARAEFARASDEDDPAVVGRRRGRVAGARPPVPRRAGHAPPRRSAAGAAATAKALQSPPPRPWPRPRRSALRGSPRRSRASRCGPDCGWTRTSLRRHPR